MTNKKIAKNLLNDEIAKWLVYCSSKNNKEHCNKCIFNDIDIENNCVSTLMTEAAIRISVLNG